MQQKLLPNNLSATNYNVYGNAHTTQLYQKHSGLKIQSIFKQSQKKKKPTEILSVREHKLSRAEFSKRAQNHLSETYHMDKRHPTFCKE